MKALLPLVAIIMVTSFTGPVAYAKGGGHSSGKSSKSSNSSSSSAEHVSGYTKSNGTYVAPHDRTRADHDKTNNWSTKGNANPETGKPGYVDPYK